ncbi:hypothetical protein ACQP25_23100 [Microtetraspora malaysiensis]|uniref:hypothetical protein n=1 Tax=Microtetraspora malaysiensis TaxID=161358 RepID=UPI003D8F78AD
MLTPHRLLAQTEMDAHRPAAEIGRLLVEMAVAGLLKLNRAVTVLDDAVRAGAHASVWSILTEALPALLPAVGERARAGLGDLLAVGARVAALAGARRGRDAARG